MVEKKPQKPSPKDVTLQPKTKVPIAPTKKEPAVKTMPEPVKEPVIIAVPLNNIQKFAIRRKVILQEIPVISSIVGPYSFEGSTWNGISLHSKSEENFPDWFYS